MSIGVTMQIIGLDKLKKKLDKKNVIDPLNDGVKKATQLAQRLTAAATPRITGNLASGILQPIKFGEGFAEYGTIVQYASKVEFGIGKMRPRHIEGGVRVFGEGMFSYGFRQMQDKMKGILNDVVGTIEARWR